MKKILLAIVVLALCLAGLLLFSKPTMPSDKELDQRLAAAQQAAAEPPEVWYNGREVGGQLKPVLLDNVWYAQDFALISMLAERRQMAVYPVFAQAEQRLNYYVNSDWQETAELAIIVTYPYSAQVLIKRGDELKTEDMQCQAVPDKSTAVAGTIYQIERLPAIEAASYPTDKSFANGQAGSFCYQMVPLEDFVQLVVPSASVEYDKAANKILIVSDGTY